MFERDISELDVLDVLIDGDVIEEYADDFPFPSYLVCCKVEKGQFVHVVVACDKSTETLYVITAYPPDEMKWSDDFRKRRT
jgi:hypothetical protein